MKNKFSYYLTNIIQVTVVIWLVLVLLRFTLDFNNYLSLNEAEMYYINTFSDIFTIAIVILLFLTLLVKGSDTEDSQKKRP